LAGKLIKRLIDGVSQGSQQVFDAFKHNWKLLLAVHIIVSVLTVIVLTPLFSLVLGWLVLASGHTALTDEDILFFFLSPTGLLALLVAGALFTTVIIFEQAVMITAVRYATPGKSIRLPQLGRYLLGKFWPLFQLALQMIGRGVFVAAPFLAVTALIYLQFLTEFDINFYLSNKPPVFWWAGSLILLCILAMTGVLLSVFSGWVLALPLLLLGHETPAQVLKMSRSASESRRIPITLALLTLTLLHSGMFGIVSLLANLSLDGMVAFAGNSLQVMAYLLGGLLVVWLIANVLITFVSNSALSLVILSMYTRAFPGAGDTGMEQIQLSSPSTPSRSVSGIKLAVLAMAVSILAGLAINVAIKKLDMEDHTMVIAHRGASADAPENTMAAMELAIEQGADWVEIDVQETRDGEVVVIHDSDLKKIGGSGLRVYESSLLDLQSVDIGSWKDPSFSDQRVPTLQQVLELCKNRISVLIELKYYGPEERLEERVVQIVEAAGMQDQIVVMSLSYPGIVRMKSIRPEWDVGLLSSVAIGDITRLEVDFFAVNANFANRAFIKRVHKRQSKVLVWTVNDPVSMSAMMSRGVDGIITDKPGLASAVRSQRNELDTHERIMIQLASLIGKQPARPEQ
jgi:glycerophosphoryl diester phosphodiesterase